MEGPYTIVPNADDRGYDVVRMAPTTIATEHTNCAERIVLPVR